MNNKLWFFLALFVFTFSMAAQAVQDSTDIKQDQSENPDQQTVTGTVNKITKSKISLKTDEGKTRNFTISQMEQSGISIKDLNLKPGDRILLSLNRQNQILEINKLPNPFYLTPIPNSNKDNPVPSPNLDQSPLKGS